MSPDDSQRSLWAILIGIMAKGSLAQHIVDHDGDPLVFGVAEWMIFLLFFLAAMYGHLLFDLRKKRINIEVNHGRSK